MKKILAFALVTVMALCCMTGCGKEYDQKFIGKWQASQMIVDGTTYTDYYGIPLDAMIQLDIQDKGKGEWHSPMSGANDSASDMLIKWSENDDDKNSIEITAYIKNDSDSEQHFSLSCKDGMLVLEEDGVSFRLERVDSFTEYTQEQLKDMLSSMMTSLLQ